MFEVFYIKFIQVIFDVYVNSSEYYIGWEVFDTTHSKFYYSLPFLSYDIKTAIELS